MERNEFVIICLLYTLLIIIILLVRNNTINSLFVLHRNKIENNTFLFFVIDFLSISTIVSVFLIFGLTQGDDLEFHLSRISGIANGLSNSTFPVLIYPNYFNGTGYANGIFYPDLFLYLPAFLTLSGISVISSYKIFISIIIICAYYSMQFCTYKITHSKISSRICSIIYITSSYFFTDLYIRAALGETLTFIFYPFLLLGLYELLYRDAKYGGIYYTIGIFGICMSHIISIIFCIFISIFVLLLNIKTLILDKNRSKYLIFYGLLSIGLSAFFIFPLIEAMQSDIFLYTKNYSSKKMII